MLLIPSPRGVPSEDVSIHARTTSDARDVVRRLRREGWAVRSAYLSDGQWTIVAERELA